MMRSMFAGVSGLKAHQIRMDVIGNNIANVNTAGYKTSRATFQEMLSQTLRGATAPTGNRGGMNPQQVGLGVNLGSIDVIHGQGNTQPTGNGTDLAIEGDGFFVLGQGEQRVYTRAGIFGLDNGTEGNLVSLVNGMRVMGYKADSNGNIDTNTDLEPIYISTSETVSPQATSLVSFAGNLDNRYAESDPVTRSIQVYDSRGREQTVVINLDKVSGENEWTWTADWVLESNVFASQGTLLTPNQEYVVEGKDLVLKDEKGDVIVANSTDGRVWTLAGSDQIVEFDRALEDGNIVTSSGSAGEMVLTHNHKLMSEPPGGMVYVESDPVDAENLALESGQNYRFDASGGKVGDVTYSSVLRNGDTIIAVSDDDMSWTLLVDNDTLSTEKIHFQWPLTEGTSVQTSVNDEEVVLAFSRELTASENPGTPAGGTISFYPDGTFSDVTANEISLDPELAGELNIELDFSEFTHFADTFTGKFVGQDGYANGALESYSIDQNGRIVGSFSNGLTRNLGQIALARFTNPAGLERSGGTMFAETPNSGTAQVGAAGVPGFGSISPSSLEMSNVDLSEEFTDMIITQRGFQANSRIITSSDEMLQELVNLKR